MVTVDSQNLVWRPMVVSDAAAMADLLNAIDAHDHVWGHHTTQDHVGNPYAYPRGSTRWDGTVG